MKDGYQDIIHLSGLVFIQRDFLEDILDQGLDAMLDKIEAIGDLTDDQRATFEACINDPELQPIIKNWWKVYDDRRDEGAIPVADPWQLGT